MLNYVFVLEHKLKFLSTFCYVPCLSPYGSWDRDKQKRLDEWAGFVLHE